MAETLRELVVALSPELKRSKARPRRLRMRRRWFCRAARAIWRQPGAVRIDGVDRDCGPQGRCPGGVIRVAARWAVLRSRKRGERVIRNKRRADAKQGPSAPIENAGKRTMPAPGLRGWRLPEPMGPLVLPDSPDDSATAWRMKEIDEMNMLGFLRLRAWDATREQEKKKPRHAFIDEV